MLVTDLMAMPNVSVSNNFRKKLGNHVANDYEMRSMLYDTVMPLARDFPQWRFYVSEGETRGTNLFVNRFTVEYDGEELGTIGCTTYRRQYAIAISCRRAAQQVERGDTVHTRDAGKAKTLIKKLFVKPTTGERLEIAQTQVERLMSQAMWQSRTRIDHEYNKFRPKMLEFVFETTLRENFELFLEHDILSKNAVANYLNAKQEQLAIQEIVGKHKTQKTCLTLLGDDKYVVQTHGGTIEVYNDSTFPEALRGRLGLLKLVEDGQMVGGAGCRISNAIFVLVTE